MNKLPKRWYIENKYPEVRRYLAELKKVPAILSPAWEYTRKSGGGYKYIGDEGYNDDSYHGANAWKEDTYIHNMDQITIEEFRLATQKDEIINTYPIY